MTDIRDATIVRSISMWNSDSMPMVITTSCARAITTPAASRHSKRKPTYTRMEISATSSAIAPVCARSAPTLGPTNSIRLTAAFWLVVSLITLTTLLPSSWLPLASCTGGIRTMMSRLLPKFCSSGSSKPAFCSDSRIWSISTGFSREISITVPPVKSRPQLKPFTPIMTMDRISRKPEMPKAQ